MNKISSYLITAWTLLAIGVHGQAVHHPELQATATVNYKKVSVSYHKLYQFGHADAFVNGLYRGILPLSELKDHGDFGLGAPDLVNGELTLNNGKVYQSTADGKTTLAPDSLKTSFAMVTFFKPDLTFSIFRVKNLKDLYQQLDHYLENKNGMFAIRIKGLFDVVKTRAFPSVDKDSHVPLAQMLDKQKLFNTSKSKGVLIGYSLPAYLSGINISGFHFHFISDNMDAGGHVLEMSSAEKIIVEISELKGFLLEVPDDESFKKFPFKGSNKEDLQKVEKGY